MCNCVLVHYAKPNVNKQDFSMAMFVKRARRLQHDNKDLHSAAAAALVHSHEPAGRPVSGDVRSLP